ncbi:hypothetical protein I203_107494 [Kwoniella mangroviensis CBS 8507]|uniref:hypothetical protein n=1 Tax=Kwoniella mangroviensis CBS 8507 TaxID=1296122 RepID=UPI00080D0C24|nr:uncharacterized protein I203_02246 [Kwoniella mangroviensis CBS 8507]OCF68855.1 hypothetical protein I203_02246 [Kwoniella mangroviensis CBS 8507]
MSPMSARTSPIALSFAHVYTLSRDPNKSPPVRSYHLPMSSQTSPGEPSSPVKKPTSSNEVEMHFDSIQEDGEEDEFEGLETIGFSQWEREVPNFKSRINDKQEKEGGTSSSSQNQLRIEEEIDELDESEYGLEVPMDLIQDEEVREQVAIHSPIANPSSPPLRTPAFSLPSLNSDIPSGPYPQTPHSPSHSNRHQQANPNFRSSSPVNWTPSPLSSRGKKRSLVILSDDSDQDEENDQTIAISQKDNSGSPNKKGKSSKVIQSGDDEDEDEEEEEEEEEPLAVQKRRREKGKGKEILPSHEEELINIRLGSEAQAPDGPTLDDLFRDDTNDLNFDSNQHDYHEDHYEDEEEEDDYGDFPFDEVDLDFPDTNKKKSKSKSKSRSPEKQKNQTLANDLFPPDEPGEDLEDKENHDRSFSGGHGSSISILDKFELVKKNEWDIPLISDLEIKWQDFYKNHWRRGVDKLNAKSTTTTRRDQVGTIRSDDESEEEDIRPKKTTAAKRGGPWGWRGRGRGRGRGAWRGRVARGKARKK